MNFPIALPALYVNGSGKSAPETIAALAQEQKAPGATAPQANQDEVELNILTAERGAAFLSGILPVIDVQPAAHTSTMAAAVNAYARMLGSQVDLLLTLRRLGLYVLTDEQARRLDEVKEEISEVVDSLAWGLEAKDQLQAIIRDECA